MDDNLRIKLFILKKLFRKHIIGGRHTSLDNLQKGLPPDLRGSAKDVAKDLIKEELLLTKPTHDGIHVSLNPRRLSEIRQLIGISA